MMLELDWPETWGDRRSPDVSLDDVHGAIDDSIDSLLRA